MLVTAAINLGLLTALFFIVGMIKPQWSLFFMDKPSRFIILMITTVLTMVSFTMFGEGNRRGQKPNEWTKVPESAAKPITKPVTVPVVPVPEIKDDASAPVSQAPNAPTAPAPVPTTVSPAANTAVVPVPDAIPSTGANTAAPAPTVVPTPSATEIPAKN
jgi:hypothetical protein